MNETELRISKDIASSNAIIKHKEQLVSEGLYPAKYNLPVSIQFELTSKCNLYCMRSKGNYSLGTLMKAWPGSISSRIILMISGAGPSNSSARDTSISKPVFS